MYSDAVPGPAGDGHPPAVPEQPAKTGEPAETGEPSETGEPAETGKPAQPEAKLSGATAAAIVNEGKCLQVKSGNLDLFCQSHLNFTEESQIMNVAFV